MSSIKQIDLHRKNIKKMILMLSRDDGEQALRNWAARIPFIMIDEKEFTTKDEMLETLRSQLRDTKTEYLVEKYEAQLGSQGLKNIRDLAKTKLEGLGIDPDEA